MCKSAAAALDPANMKGCFRNTGFEAAEVITVYGQTPEMSTGARELMELQSGNCIIVKILSNRVVIFNQQGYHKLVSTVTSVLCRKPNFGWVK